jgi:hypothetical protein
MQVSAILKQDARPQATGLSSASQAPRVSKWDDLVTVSLVIINIGVSGTTGKGVV